MNRSAIFSAAAFSTFALMSTSALSATKIGVVSAADASVQIVSSDGTQRIVKLGDAIYADDTVKTDGKGKAQLIFEDRSTITINENSELKIDRFIFDPEQSSGEMAVEGVKGAFRFIGGALSKKQPVKIKTPVATIGIRGGIADTHIGPDGQTDAVFLYGEEMSMTNANGQTSTTRNYGTGFSLSNAYNDPVNLPPEMVTSRLEGFSHTAGAGGGLPVPPTPESIAPGMGGINTQNSAPLPLPPGASLQGAPGGASGNSPAPIVIVDDSDTSVMQASRLSVMASGNTLQTNTQTASGDVRQLSSFVTSGSITTQMVNDPAFYSAMVANISADGIIDDAELALIAQYSQLAFQSGGSADALINDIIATGTSLGGSTPLPTDPQLADSVAGGTTSDDPLPATTTDTVSGGTSGGTTAGGGGGGGGSAPPPTETFTALTDTIGGEYVILAEDDATPGLDVTEKGLVKVTEESSTRYRITFDGGTADSISTTDDRYFTIEKLTTVGLSPARTVNLVETGQPDEAYTYKGYSTKAHGFQIYSFEQSANPAVDAEISFFTGRDIWQPQTGGAGTLAMAGIDSAAATEAINGVLFYDFAAVFDETNPDAFGAFKYNSAHSDFHVEPVYTTPFGMAVDWNSGREANMFTGHINWLAPAGGRSSVTAGYARTNAGGVTGSGDNYTIAGKRLAFLTPNVALSSVDNTEFAFTGIGALSDNIFRPKDGPVEALVMDFVNFGSGSGIVASPLSILDSAGVNEGIQSAVIKTAEQGNALPTTVNNSITAATSGAKNMLGFAAGTKLEHNGTSYVAATYSNVAASANTDKVAIDTTTNGQVAGTSTVKLYNYGGTPSRYINATFGGSDKSTYINDKLYVAQQVNANNNGVNASTTAGQQGLLVSADAINNASQSIATNFGTQYRCADCQFVHWGVWSGNLGDGAPADTKVDYASMIPYVAGEMTNLSAVTNVTPMTASYKGEAYATVYETGVAPIPENIAGKSWATVNFAGGGSAPQLQTLGVAFNSVKGAPLSMEANTGGGVAMFTGTGAYSGKAQFNAPVVAGADVVANGASMTGQFNGALFGTTGQEIGGNYIFNRTGGTGANIEGGGIFLGKQRP